MLHHHSKASTERNYGPMCLVPHLFLFCMRSQQSRVIPFASMAELFSHISVPSFVMHFGVMWTSRDLLSYPPILTLP